MPPERRPCADEGRGHPNGSSSRNQGPPQIASKPSGAGREESNRFFVTALGGTNRTGPLMWTSTARPHTAPDARALSGACLGKRNKFDFKPCVTSTIGTHDDFHGPEAI